MKPFGSVPREIMERKPPHGQACTRCGACCLVTLCPLGRALFGFEVGACPALQWDGDQSVCGLVATPDRYRPTKARLHGRATLANAARHLIGAGQGCDARFNGEPRDPTFDAKLEATKDPRATRKARRAWGVHNAPDDFGY